MIENRHSDADRMPENQLNSIIEENNLDEFLNYATLSNRSFAVDRDMTLIVDDDPSGVYQVGKGSIVSKKELDIQNRQRYQQIRAYGGLPIPKRPKWNTKMTKVELHEAENTAFLTWRRKLAQLEEAHPDVLLTPFEKNLQVWRQLWRVIERSHVCVQIVDCRNPLTFRNKDIERYLKKLDSDKQNILLLNKADLLSDAQRELWAQYFQKNNVPFLFFSAKFEQEKIANTATEQKRVDNLQFDEIDIEEWENPALNDPTHIFDREELLCFFKSFLKNVNLYQKAVMYQKDQGEPRIMIGMVGFPNVGKSSVINVLTGLKIVSVGSTPGKTKHFQTIPIGQNIMLCDCPGLVFPSISTTKEDMVVDGVLPIDQLREHRPPVALMCRRIPKRVLEIVYGMKIQGKDQYTTTQKLLTAYCKLKGMHTHGGVPNAPAAARVLLKDYVKGKVLYCHPPPGAFEEFHPTAQEDSDEEDDVKKGEEYGEEDDELPPVEKVDGESAIDDDDEDEEEDIEIDEDEGDEEQLDEEYKFNNSSAQVEEDDEDESENLVFSETDHIAQQFNELNVNNEDIELRYLEKKATKKTTKRSRRAKADLASAPFAVEITEDDREILHRVSDLRRHAKNERREIEKAQGKRIQKRTKGGKLKLKYGYQKPSPIQYASPIEAMKQKYIKEKALENVQKKVAAGKDEAGGAGAAGSTPQG